MQKFFAATAATLVCGLALAAGPQSFRGEAKLAAAVAAAKDVTIDGVAWHCEGDTCVGEAKNRATLDSQMKECRKVAAELGALSGYRSRGRDMSSSSVEQCNKAAKA